MPPLHHTSGSGVAVHFICSGCGKLRRSALLPGQHKLTSCQACATRQTISYADRILVSQYRGGI